MCTLCKRLIENARFEAFILGVIVLTAVMVGLETSAVVMARYERILLALNTVVQAIFVVEIALRLGAYWPRVHRFFRDGWNVFDFAVVTSSLSPEIGVFVTVARVVRLLRVARLVSWVPDLRLIVDAMLCCIPSIANVMLLLALLLYVYAILGYQLFSDGDPQRWGSLGSALMTVFKLLTLDSWVEIYDTARAVRPGSWLYFTSFILVASFVVVNMFVAVLLESMESTKRLRRHEGTDTSHEADTQFLIAEARSVLDRLEAALPSKVTAS